MSLAGDGLFAALAFTAVSVGALHSLAPDHWVPFAALARARGWSAGRPARVTFFCGFGHVTVSVLLGLVGLLVGVELMESVGQRMEALAGLLLIGFGLGYGVWGLGRAVGKQLHSHTHGDHEHGPEHQSHDHHHGHHGHSHAHARAVEEDPSRVTAWTLFLLFSADPCVAVIPLLFAAAPLGAVKTVMIVLLYELATIGTMIVLVLPARAGVEMFRPAWFERYGDAVAGGVIAVMGLTVMSLGI